MHSSSAVDKTIMHELADFPAKGGIDKNYMVKVLRQSESGWHRKKGRWNEQVCYDR